MSDCSEVSTWSSCTGVAVCVTLIVPPSSSSGAAGEPGLRSTKKLPSRKMRGRILAVASSCSGSPSSSIWSTTTAASVVLVGLDLLDLADVDAGDPHRRAGPDRVRRLEDGVDLVRRRERDVLGEAEERRSRRSRPARSGRSATGLSGVRRRHQGLPSVRACCVPRRVREHGAAARVRLVARLALARLARARPCSGTGWCGGGCPAVGPLAGADAGPPSLFGPCGVATMMKRCQVPLRSPSLSSDETLRNHSVR